MISMNCEPSWLPICCLRLSSRPTRNLLRRVKNGRYSLSNYTKGTPPGFTVAKTGLTGSPSGQLGERAHRERAHAGHLDGHRVKAEAGRRQRLEVREVLDDGDAGPEEDRVHGPREVV